MHNPEQGMGDARRSHGHAPIRREHGRPGQASEDRDPITYVGLLHQQLLRDSQCEGRKALDAAARGNLTVQCKLNTVLTTAINMWLILSYRSSSNCASVYCCA